MSAPDQAASPDASPAGQALPGGGSSSLADGQWHRLHPLTPLFKGGLVLIIVAGIVISNMRDRLIAWVVDAFAPGTRYGDYDSDDPLDWVVENNLILWALLAVLGVLIVLIVAFWVVWRFQQFRITDEHVEVRKGIVFRSQRRAPLDRVQGVNLTRPFPARLIGMAKLEVVGAGTDANVPLEYLATARAESVRADILRLASGARAARDARLGRAPATRAHLVEEVGAGLSGLIDGVDLADVAPESVVKIPTGRLIGSQLIAGVVWFAFFLAILAVVMITMIPVAARNADGGGWMILLGTGLGVGIPLVITAVAVTWAQISRSLRYSIAPTPDGVRITYGLLTTVTETIPPGRIFAVEVSQGVLWRPFGWWIVRINRMTGRSATQQASSSTQQFNVVLPVGTREDVERVLELILPDFPAHDRSLLWEHGILGPHGAGADPYTTMARRARWRRPMSWRRHGFALTDFALLLRRGRVWRKLAVFPLARLQGLSVAQGPIDRLQKVAWAQAHSITGPISGAVVGLERDEVVDLLLSGSRAAVAAATHDRSHRWRDGDADAGETADAGAPERQVAEPAPDAGVAAPYAVAPAPHAVAPAPHAVAPAPYTAPPPPYTAPPAPQAPAPQAPEPSPRTDEA
ncbi:PH domain-containing protein [Microbacterium sp. No. 7]|uniref:PH domain-containing protein n=1 Tax=Microbacterium sp. No. 7 TaxID=1714373 RepID=UPI0006ECF3B4|nr:PH domain-containing protein [Microbacterium sp. No. 7]ALJ22008.1 hypothetical protein AOA12_19765 [Microbacterium sp. No. 7]